MCSTKKRLCAAVMALMLTFMFAIATSGCGKNEVTTTGSNQKSSVKETPKETTKDTTQDGSGTKATQENTTGTLVPEPGAKLKIWETEDDGSGKWMQDLAKEFEQKYGVQFTYEPVNHTDSAVKLPTDGPAKKAADVMCVVNDRVGTLVASGLVYPNDLSNPSDFLDSAVKACTFEGKLYGYPTSIETYALIYNKDLVSSPPKTWDEIIAFAKIFSDVKKQKYGFMLEPGNFYFTYSFLSGYGGYVFGKNGTDPDDIGLNNEGSIEGAKLIKSLKDIAPLKSGDITYDIKEGLFKEKKLAMHIMGPWALKGYKDAGVNFAVVPLPTLPNGKRPISFSGVRALYVNSYTAYPNAAKLFAQYCTTKDALLKRFKSINQIPPRKDIMDDPAITQDVNMHAFLEQAQYSEPMPSIPQMAAVWDQMKAAVSTIWDDKNADVKQVLDNAVKKIKETNAVTTKK